MKKWYARMNNGEYISMYFYTEKEYLDYMRKTYQESLKGGYINKKDTTFQSWCENDDMIEFWDNIYADYTEEEALEAEGINE